MKDVFHTTKQSKNWKDVEDFKNLWGFLPNDFDVLEDLSKEALIDIAMCGMTVIAQRDSYDVAIQRIKNRLTTNN